MLPLHAIAFILVIGILVCAMMEQHGRLKTARLQRDEWKALVDRRANIAQQFAKSCRLIDIKRDVRFNYFTFARGNDVFTIETMGLLSDTPDDWRKQAGLGQ